MAQIRTTFRSAFCIFDSTKQSVLKSDVKKSRICPIYVQSDPRFWSKYESLQGERIGSVLIIFDGQMFLNGQNAMENHIYYIDLDVVLKRK